MRCDDGRYINELFSDTLRELVAFELKEARNDPERLAKALHSLSEEAGLAIAFLARADATQIPGIADTAAGYTRDVAVSKTPLVKLIHQTLERRGS